MTELTNASMQALRKNFLAVNENKLDRCTALLSNIESDFLTLLPLLFHINDSQLPGYISKEVPASIPDYFPNKYVSDAGKRLIRKNFSIKNQMKLSLSIQGIYLINAKGSTANNSQGFEVWLCIEDKVDQKGWELLKQKNELIQEWALAKNIILTIQLFTPTNWYKATEKHQNSKENKETSEQLALPSLDLIDSSIQLDKLYYSGLLLAGRFPIWWLISSEEPMEYQRQLDLISQNTELDDSQYIDFGPVNNLNATQFNKYCIQQLILDFKTPYHSILDIILSECYAYHQTNNAQSGFISVKLKALLHQSVTDINRLDSTLLLLETLEDYLSKRGEAERLELVKRCYYVQAREFNDESIKTRQADWHKKIILQLVTRWQWNEQFCKHLELRKDWQLDYIIKQSDIVDYALAQTLQFYQLQVEKLPALASETRLLTQLQQCFSINFDTAQHKIRRIHSSIASIPLHQKIMTIIPINFKGKAEILNLYAGSVTVDTAKTSQPLKSSTSLIELLSWGFFNQIISEDTSIYAYSDKPTLSERYIQRIIRYFNAQFNKNKIGHAAYNELFKPERLNQLALFVNFGIDPLKNHIKDGHELATSYIDTFNFSSKKINIVTTFEWVTLSNWKEAKVIKSSDGTKTLVSFLSLYIGSIFSRNTKQIETNSISSLKRIELFSPQGGRELLVRTRVQEVLDDIYNFFKGHQENKSIESARYFIVVEDKPIIFYFKESNQENRQLQVLQFHNVKEMAALFSVPHNSPRNIKFGPGFIPKSYYPTIFNLSVVGNVQLYYHIDNEKEEKLTQLFIVDERGSLFSYTSTTENVPALLHSYLIFIQQVQQHIHKSQPLGSQNNEASKIRLYQLIKNKNGYIDANEVAHPEDLHKHYLNIRVSTKHLATKTNEAAKTSITIHCDDQEFVSSEHNEHIFRVLSEHLIDCQDTEQQTAFYITDLEVTREFLALKDSNQAQTFHYLKSRKQLEQRINNFITEQREQR